MRIQSCAHVFVRAWFVCVRVYVYAITLTCRYPRELSRTHKHTGEDDDDDDDDVSSAASAATPKSTVKSGSKKSGFVSVAFLPSHVHVKNNAEVCPCCRFALVLFYLLVKRWR